MAHEISRVVTEEEISDELKRKGAERKHEKSERIRKLEEEANEERSYKRAMLEGFERSQRLFQEIAERDRQVFAELFEGRLHTDHIYSP